MSGDNRSGGGGGGRKDREPVAADSAADASDHGADANPAVSSQTPRLVVSWLIVGLPLVYGIYQTISRTLPLFGG